MPLPDGPYGDISDAEYWEYQRALQQAATDAANQDKRRTLMPTYDEEIQAHLDRQADCPDGFVRLDDGRIRPVGGNDDNASPERGSADYLPDPKDLP